MSSKIKPIPILGKIIATVLLVFFAGSALSEIEWPSYRKGAYPEPRYPDLAKLVKEKDLVDVARIVVERPGNRDPHHPGYDIQEGERVLIGARETFDPRILDAFATAIREAGGEPDLYIVNDNSPRIWDGWMEVTRPLLAVSGGPPGGRFDRYIKAAVVGEYDLLIHGDGGPIPATYFDWEYMHWDSLGKFLTGAPEFPGKVREMIEEKFWAKFRQARRVRVTDPEGTDISWSMKPEYFEMTEKAWPGYPIVMKGHISLTPLFFVPPGHDAEGVLAGTINHSGGFPHIQVYIEDAKVKRIEGGGRYGEMWQEFLERYADVQFPGFPGKGAGYLVEAALGTQPKVARVPETMLTERMTWERLRSGVIHFGVGLVYPPGLPELYAFEKFIGDNSITSAHFHVHTYFTTVDFEMPDGSTERVVDRGRVVLLDDPEVRKAAAEYGDPDEILSEAWIPEIPGINIPGDYRKDFANNPTAYILDEMRRYYGDEFIPDFDHPEAPDRKD